MKVCKTCGKLIPFTSNRRSFCSEGCSDVHYLYVNKRKYYIDGKCVLKHGEKWMTEANWLQTKLKEKRKGVDKK